MNNQSILLLSLLCALGSVFLFSCKIADSAKTYTLTTTASPEEAGKITPSEGKFNNGDQIELRAVPNDGWRFVRWEGGTSDLDSVSAPVVNLRMHRNITLVGIFKKREYPLSITIEGEGEVGEEVLTAKSYEHGTLVRLTAVPAEGWRFEEWTGDAQDTSTVIELTIDRAKEVTATFEMRLPRVTISEVAKISANSASVGGASEGINITERGVCISTSPVPDMEDRCKALGSGTGSFETTIEELVADTRYHVRSYATNSAGTAWSQQREFTTLDGIPTLTTTEPFHTTASSVITGGIITDDGGADITARGVCYVEGSDEPNLSDNCVEESGSGVGSFEVLLENLTPDQHYTVRAYATNSLGTFYGREQNF